MSTKAISQSSQQAQQLAFQQRMHLDSLQMLLKSYTDIQSDTDPVKAKLSTAISQLLEPFLPASTIITN